MIPRHGRAAALLLCLTVLIPAPRAAAQTRLLPDPARPHLQPPAPPANLLRLQRAYPDAFALELRRGEWGVAFPDGTYIPWDEGRQHGSYRELLESPNLKDMFHFSYTPLPDDAAAAPIPQPGHDPGRIRHQGFFAALYGSTRSEVERNLREIEWLPPAQSGESPPGFRFSAATSAARQLEGVIAELRQLPPEYRRYLVPAAGGYYWRTIAGTQRLSMHALGIAVDINPAWGDYWRWDADPAYRNRIPLEIVRIFEQHGFIWGGQWHHYDTLHFEYRPELLPPPGQTR